MSEKGTEQATPQRKKKAQEKGDGVRSRELLSAIAMLGGVMMLGATAHGFFASWGKVYRRKPALCGCWRGQRTSSAGTRLCGSMIAARSAASGFGAGGELRLRADRGSGAERRRSDLHPNAAELKFSRLNPATNLKNLFSLRSATRLAKSLVPAAVMVVLGWGALKALMMPMPVMSHDAACRRPFRPRMGWRSMLPG